MLNYLVEYRSDWTAQTKVRGYDDRRKAENYARQLSDRKHGTAYVVAYMGDTDRVGHKAFFNGALDHVEGAYA